MFIAPLSCIVTLTISLVVEIATVNRVLRCLEGCMEQLMQSLVLSEFDQTLLSMINVRWNLCSDSLFV